MVGDGFQVKTFQLCFYPVVGLWPNFSKHFWLLESLLDSTSKKYGRWCLPSFANTTWFSHNAWWWDACSFIVKFELQSWEFNIPPVKGTFEDDFPFPKVGYVGVTLAHPCTGDDISPKSLVVISEQRMPRPFRCKNLQWLVAVLKKKRFFLGWPYEVISSLFWLAILLWILQGSRRCCQVRDWEILYGEKLNS